MVPPPRFHTVRYAGVLASAIRLHLRNVPRPRVTDPAEPPAPLGGSRCGWRPWAELMQRVFQIDLERCPLCGAPMKLRALVTELTNIRRYLRHLDESTDLPPRSPARNPPYFRSQGVRRQLTPQLGPSTGPAARAPTCHRQVGQAVGCVGVLID